jgi:GGDEF domain-containing protein
LYILTIRDITLRRHTEQTIRNLAYHDPLTGLPNRLLFNDPLTRRSSAPAGAGSCSQ